MPLCETKLTYKKLSQNRLSNNKPGFGQLVPLLICPACKQDKKPLLTTQEHLQCSCCNTRFPLYRSGATNVLNLFRDPNSTRLEWKARFNGFLQFNKLEQQRLKAAVNCKRVSVTGNRRIVNLLQARLAECRQISELIDPLALNNLKFDGDPTRWLLSKLPKNQGLTAYSQNIFRDWAWNNGENNHLLHVVQSVLPSKFATAAEPGELGKVLTLGSGASRLPYDIHRAYAPELSVVLDINPLLIFLASRIIGGETVALYEFPIAPLDSENFAVLQECVAPEAIEPSTERFKFLLADGMNPPFAQASFDMVLTPWLIDIMPQNLSEFIPRINRLLQPGGLWVNTGSLAFFHADETWRYSEEEVVELCQKNGFQILKAERRTIPYLQSPFSAHGRMETVFSFCAKKIEEVSEPSPYEYLPHWIRDNSQLIPSEVTHSIIYSKHLLQANVFAAIDGKRTLSDIGLMIAKQYDLPITEATHAVRRVLVDQYEGDDVL